MTNKLLSYLKLMRLNKPIGILLLLWPTLWALWIAAQGFPDWQILIVFLLGVVVMRSAGCVINDIADRNFDGEVERTKRRPLITGEVTLKESIIIFLVLCLAGFWLVLQLNIFTVVLSFVGLLLAIIYPFSKRVTYFPQVVLGAAFAWSVPMVFSAQSNHLPNVCWLIYAIAVLWPVAYDSIYALMDKNDDVKVGIKSTVIYFGRFDVILIFLLQALFIFSLCWLGIIQKMNFYYFLSILTALALICYQYHLVTLKKYYAAFLNNNWVGLVVFGGIVGNYLG